jgi:uncharacterized protein YceK
MKLARFRVVVLGTVLAGVSAVMLTANPDRKAYEQYAARELTTYLKAGVCDRAQAQLDLQALLRGYCKMLVDTGRPFLQEAIASGTTRKNFLIFSIYQTELSFATPLPSYQFSTIAVLKTFYLYEALEI